jgi:enterochelin esterase family protein
MHSLLERAQREGTPLIDGETVTFVWSGRQAPQLIGDFNRWDDDRALPLAEVAPSVWAYALPLPRDAYIEYAYTYQGQHVRDPYNRHVTPNGTGAFNQFFLMPDATMTPLVRRKRGVAAGTVTRHIVVGDHLVVGNRRIVYLYQPPVDAPCPLLVVFDGYEYLRRAHLPQIVDNLIAQRRIRPIALALVTHAGQARFVEYSCNDSVIGFLLRRVLPLARAQLNLLDPDATPGAYGLLGASMGGLMALYTALRVPEVFGHVLSQSGAFAFNLMGHDSLIADLIRCYETRPLKIWMDAGRFEYLLSSNQRMHALLRERGYDVTYREYSGAHNYTVWRNDVGHGLEALFATKDSGGHNGG